MIDLYNLEIIGHSAGPRKNAALVHRTFASVQEDLRQFQLFHTDRGSEFKNANIDGALDSFDIERSLSNKGNPYDNAVAEATFKAIKIEFVRGSHFINQQDLDLELFDFVNWFNHIRIHGSLDYLTPAEFKSKDLNVFV